MRYARRQPSSLFSRSGTVVWHSAGCWRSAPGRRLVVHLTRASRPKHSIGYCQQGSWAGQAPFPFEEQGGMGHSSRAAQLSADSSGPLAKTLRGCYSPNPHGSFRSHQRIRTCIRMTIQRGCRGSGDPWTLPTEPSLNVKRALGTVTYPGRLVGGSRRPVRQQ